MSDPKLFVGKEDFFFLLSREKKIVDKIRSLKLYLVLSVRSERVNFIIFNAFCYSVSKKKSFEDQLAKTGCQFDQSDLLALCLVLVRKGNNPHVS